MPLLANQIGWWPIHAALAWVYTRDVDFTLYAAKRSYKSLTAGIDAYQHNTEESVHPVLNSEDDAWPRLRDAISTGTVRARGVPSNDEELPSARTPAAEEELPPAEAALLVLAFSWFGKISLRPEKWKFNEGRYWHDVKITRDDLEEQFPTLGSAPALGSAAAQSPRRTSRAHVRQATADVIKEKYGPNGPGPGITEGQWSKEVIDIMKERKLKEPSVSTLRRALSDVKRERT
jgi:hypothetical protein